MTDRTEAASAPDTGPAPQPGAAPADTGARATVPELTVVVPTFNERENIRPLVARLHDVLRGIAWEVLFVDDDSPDGTAQEVIEVARHDPHVRVHQRIGRRGLAGACIEGMLSAISPVVAVMDADMQHDDTLLPKMFAALGGDPDLDLVIGSRKVAGGSAGSGLSALRAWGSDRANGLARRLLRISASDPMSGFFMLRRARFNEVVLELQTNGFKILADMLSVSRGRWKVKELPYTFRERQFGSSKMDSAVTLEFLGLLLVRLTGGIVPIRFVLFLMVGFSGLGVQLLVLNLLMMLAGAPFAVAQTFGVIVAMTSNFVLNNMLTYHDRSLRGWAFLRGLLSFYVVCAVGAVANVGVASETYALLGIASVASALGAVVGALWNFWVSLLVTWRAR